jgi:N-acetyl-1-D-myo-inositol-2-amino-2-deoxy-alpha-D-glucopyranoside deacetylase
MNAADQVAPTSALPAGWPVFSAQTRLLVVAPHPDDETIATGLLIQQVRAAGGAVRILLLTAGDNNPWPQRWLERRLRIGPAERARWGRRRHAEMLQALQRLDVPAQELQLLGWPDLGVTDQLLQAGGAAVQTLAAAIDQFHPSLLAVPALGDRHPDHAAAHVLVRLALLGCDQPPQLLGYLVHGRRLGQKFVEVRGSAAALAVKQAALRAHHSQMVLSGNRLRRCAARPERFAVVPEAHGSVSAALPWRPAVWLRPWLRLSVVSATQACSWRWWQAPLRRDGHGVYHLSAVPGGAAAPCFVKLALDLPALWIFDHWGWRQLQAVAPTGLAPTGGQD